MADLLIVEDDLNLSETLVDIFELEDYTVTVATNGKDALKIIQQAPPDIIISDVMMPEMDGFELLQTLKSNHETELIPIILLTANSVVEAKIKGLEYGANDYITKPFEIRELLLKVENLLSMQEKLRLYFLSEPNVKMDSEDTIFISDLKNALEEVLDNPDLIVEDLANTMFVSKSTLQRRVKKVLGKTATQFIREYRLKYAKQLLEQSVGTTTEVAAMVGFRSLAYFSYAFKQYFGYNPTDLKRRNDL